MIEQLGRCADHCRGVKAILLEEVGEGSRLSEAVLNRDTGKTKRSLSLYIGLQEFFTDE